MGRSARQSRTRASVNATLLSCPRTGQIIRIGDDMAHQNRTRHTADVFHTTRVYSVTEAPYTGMAGSHDQHDGPVDRSANASERMATNDRR